jgi:hypothetical protein
MAPRFNAPPGWPEPPVGWTPPPGWTPDSSWPTPPAGWRYWVDDVSSSVVPYPFGSAAASYAVPPEGAPVVVVAGYKNTGLAVLLGFLFGPLGLLYSTVTGAVVMFLVNVVVGFLTLGFGLLLTWPVTVLWGGLAASRHNSRLAALGAPRL